MRVVIFGGTGMVGREVLGQCLANDKIKSILTVGRRITGVIHGKLTEIEHGDFLDFTALEGELADIDVVYYCLGVYQSQVSKAHFWKITVDYLEALIRAFERTNKNVRFCLFSVVGASTSKNSLFGAADAKGRAESILLASELSEKYMFRPGFIMPGATSKSPTLPAKLLEPIYRLFPVIGIDAPELARVMVDVGISRHKMTVFENRDMRTYDRRSGY
jgi:uncharacterized protein YbjT (DUF2867 family)